MHFIYVTCILIAIIILLMTFKWTQLDGFTSYLSVAATMTSLVLGVLAIIYSFLSSNSTNNSLGSIESAAHDIRDISEDLGRVVNDSQSLQSKAETRNQELHGLVQELRNAMDGLSNTTAVIAKSVEGLPPKFDAIHVELSKRFYLQPKTDPSDDLQSIWNKKALDSFFSILGPAGMIAFKALIDADKTKSCVNMKKLFLSETLYNFVDGVLFTSEASGIIGFSYDPADDSNGKVFLTNYVEYFESALLEQWEIRMADVSENGGNIYKSYQEKIAENIVSLKS